MSTKTDKNWPKVRLFLLNIFTKIVFQHVANITH